MLRNAPCVCGRERSPTDRGVCDSNISRAQATTQLRVLFMCIALDTSHTRPSQSWVLTMHWVLCQGHRSSIDIYIFIEFSSKSDMMIEHHQLKTIVYRPTLLCAADGTLPSIKFRQIISQYNSMNFSKTLLNRHRLGPAKIVQLAGLLN